MRLPFASLRSLLCLALLTALAACGDAPEAGGPARIDRYGDPLPAGVVARLGTERLALANAMFLTFSPDGSRLAAHNGNDQLRVWEVATGKELLRVRTPAFMSYEPAFRPLAFSPDSRAIALACPAERGPDGKRQAMVRVWQPPGRLRPNRVARLFAGRLAVGRGWLFAYRSRM